MRQRERRREMFCWIGLKHRDFHRVNWPQNFFAWCCKHLNLTELNCNLRQKSERCRTRRLRNRRNTLNLQSICRRWAIFPPPTDTHAASVRWRVSTTCLVDEHSVLPVPTASWYHPSNCQQSTAEPLRLRLHTSGIHCQLTSLRQIHCPPSVDC